LPNFRQAAEVPIRKTSAFLSFSSSSFLEGLINQCLAANCSSQPVGTADAFDYRMMLTLEETADREAMPNMTREEAARLLEEFRDLYQTLSLEERGHVKSHFAELTRVQSSMENNWEK